MKNILLAINDLKGNGAERVVISLAEQFKKMDHRVTILCFKNKVELPVDESLRIIFFKISWWRWIPRNIRGKLVSPFLDFFIRRKVGTPDLILSNLLPVDRIMSESKLNNVFLVVHNTMSHEYEVIDGRLPDSEIKKIYQKKPVVCVSKGALDDFNGLFPGHKKTSYIYNPINIDFIKKSADSPVEVPYRDYIIHVGKFSKAKRHDFLIQAYFKSDKKRALVLVGKGSEESKCMELVRNLGLEDRVFFAGFHSNPYPLIKGADLMVLTSDYEGLPTVLLEALALDKPVVSSNCKSGPSEILPKRNLYENADMMKLVEYLNSRDYQQFRTKISDKFMPEAVANEYLKLINPTK